MLFYIKTGNDKLADKSKGESLDKIGVDSIETYSLHPRTNRRKIRCILIKRYGVRPHMVKWAMQQLGWWQPQQLGITCAVERRLRFEQGTYT